MTSGLLKKGSFSYKQDNVNFLAFDGNLSINVARINNNVARVYFVDAQQVQQPIPATVAMSDATGAGVAPFLDNFLITWVDSYTLSVNGQPHMVLSNQKQQAIMGPADSASA